MQVGPLNSLPRNTEEIEWLLSDHHFIHGNFGSRPAAVDQSTLPSNITQPGAAGYESQLTGCQIHCLPHAIRDRLLWPKAVSCRWGKRSFADIREIEKRSLVPATLWWSAIRLQCSDSCLRDLRSACSSIAAAGNYGSTGGSVETITSKWTPAIDQKRVPTGGSFRAIERSAMPRFQKAAFQLTTTDPYCRH